MKECIKVNRENINPAIPKAWNQWNLEKRTGKSKILLECPKIPNECIGKKRIVELIKKEIKCILE